MLMIIYSDSTIKIKKIKQKKRERRKRVHYRIIQRKMIWEFFCLAAVLRLLQCLSWDRERKTREREGFIFIILLMCFFSCLYISIDLSVCLSICYATVLLFLALLFLLSLLLFFFFFPFSLFFGFWLLGNTLLCDHMIKGQVKPQPCATQYQPTLSVYCVPRADLSLLNINPIFFEPIDI